MFVLFTKRLEYQYKIYEQETYIIKLTHSVQQQKVLKFAIEEGKELLEKFANEANQNSQFWHSLDRTKKEKHNEVQTTLDPGKQGFLKSDLIGLFEQYTERLNNERVAMKEYMEEKFKEFKGRHPEYLRRVSELDLMYELENNNLKRLGVYDIEQFRAEIEEMEKNKSPQLKGGQTLYSRFNQIIEMELKRRKQAAEVAKMEGIIEDCTAKGRLLEDDRRFIEEETKKRKLELQDEFNNIYIEMRFLKRMVELPMQLSFKVLENAVLVRESKIEKLNLDIIKEGREKVAQLKDKNKAKNDVDEIKFNVLEKELEIEDLILESNAITRLKVTRQLQAAISNEKETEQEEKNLEEQIKTIKETREKRIKDMEKKRTSMRKEIESIKLQNETLREEGAKLQETVKQRKKIFNMMHGKVDEDENEDNEKEIVDEKDRKRKGKLGLGKDKSEKEKKADDKAYQVARNRRLFDTAKKLAQEFEGLMQELKKLKARTFPQIPAGKNNFV